MKLLNKKFKNILITATLLTGLSLTGCGNTADNKNNTTTSKTEKITEEVTTEKIEVKDVASENDAKESETLRDETLESFEEYKAFYSSEIVGADMAYKDEDGNVNVDRIDNVFKVINGEVKDLTSSEVSSAVKNIEWMIYPEYVGKKINFKQTGGMDSLQDEDDMIIFAATSPKNPHLSQYLTNEDAKEAAENYEKIMDKVIDEMNELDEDGIPKNTVSDETISEIKELMIKNENEYKQDINHINDNTTSVGQKLVENIYRLKLINLYADITGEVKFGEFYIAPNEKQVEAISAHSIRPDTMTEEEKRIYNDYKDHYLGEDYESAICELERILSDYANDNANTYGKINIFEEKVMLLKQKQALLSMKNNNSEISMTLHC